MTIKTILVDDERRALNLMTELLNQYFTDVEILDACNNVKDAVDSIKKHQPDLVFLDIEMPNYSGFDLLSFFDKVDFEVIFVTAYDQYALKAIKASAIDYILKPIKISDLRNSIERVQKLLEKKNNKITLLEFENRLKNNNQIQRITVPTNDGYIFLKVDEIICINAEGAYSQIITSDNRKIFVSKSISLFSNYLEDNLHFFKVHRSHIINIQFILRYSKKDNLIHLTNDIKITVSRSKKKEFEELIYKHSLI